MTYQNVAWQTVLVAKLWLPFAIKVTAANVSDSQAGTSVLELLKGKVPRLQKIAAISVEDYSDNRKTLPKFLDKKPL
ncbi:MAG: hypothetical protein OHK0045_17190 [Raineya sp.]